MSRSKKKKLRRLALQSEQQSIDNIMRTIARMQENIADHGNPMTLLYSPTEAVEWSYSNNPLLSMIKAK
jgi:hypothetical protein